MTVPYWADGSAAAKTWNTCQLGGVFLPGVVTVHVDSVARDVDVKKTKGKDGATMTDNGIQSAKGTIDVWLPGKAALESWVQIQPKIHPRRAGGPRTPMEIVHPLPNMFGIKNVYVTDIKPVSPTARGGFKIVLAWTEWFPAPKDIKKAAGKSVAAQAAEYYYPQKRSALRISDTAFQPTGADALDRAFGFGEGV